MKYFFVPKSFRILNIKLKPPKLEFKTTPVSRKKSIKSLCYQIFIYKLIKFKILIVFYFKYAMNSVRRTKVSFLYLKQSIFLQINIFLLKKT